MLHQLKNTDTQTSLTAVEQALNDKEKLKNLGTILQESYGSTVCDGLFDSLLGTLDTLTSSRLNQTCNTLDRLITSNIL